MYFSSICYCTCAYILTSGVSYMFQKYKRNLIEEKKCKNLKKMINIQEIKKSVKALKAKVHQTHYIASINRLNSEKKKNIITDRFHLYSLMMQQHQQQQKPKNLLWNLFDNHCKLFKVANSYY